VAWCGSEVVVVLKDHGLRIYSGGFVLHGDRRRRYWSKQGVEEIVKLEYKRGGRRGRVKAFSEASRKRLELIAASAGIEFRSMLTLTYHAKSEAWEDDAARNGRIVARSKRDLNRFLTTLRRELGAYLWVQEFQARGVLHYHVLCERVVEESRASLAWCRATDALDDAAALKHAVKVESIQGEKSARWYLGRYLGKGRQKLLPAGVEAGKHWWGRSRSMKLRVLAELVVLPEGETVPRPTAARVVRCLRRFLSGELGFRYRGGAVVDWNGELSRRAASLVAPLVTFFAPGSWDADSVVTR
jgi:hypothetical protein